VPNDGGTSASCGIGEVCLIRWSVNQDACDDDGGWIGEPKKSEVGKGAYPVKGMGDLGTEE